MLTVSALEAVRFKIRDNILRAVVDHVKSLMNDLRGDRGGYMRLTRDEAFAIRYHMGFSGTEDPGTVGKALEMFPLAYALCVADMEASYFMEEKV